MLNVKPILVYGTSRRKEATPWRMWGGIQSDSDVEEEVRRIERELKKLSADAEFPLQIMPLSKVKTVEDARSVRNASSSDVIIIYAAGGHIPSDVQIASSDVLDDYYAAMRKPLEAILSFDKPCIFFIRHRSGPLYLWYEIIHPRFLRKSSRDDVCQPHVSTGDVVVDDYGELMYRLRSLHGLKNTLGKKIIAIGGAGGWGIGSRAAKIAEDRWNLDIRTIPEQELEKKIREARKDEGMVRIARQQADELLSDEKVSLKTKKEFVVSSVLFYGVLKNLLKELGAKAITIRDCMTTIIPAAKTTACLPLSMLNDEGYLAFCESDFVVIPAGILLHHISGKPVFLNDPTYPHDGMVTLAHCTAPSRMSGSVFERMKIMTHFESDYGAAPKVKMRKGQEVTVVIPAFSGGEWVGFKGEILDSPCFPICRSQVEVRIEGNWEKLLEEMGGFHWMMVYGDYLREVGYALKKRGIRWINVSKNEVG